MHYRFSQKDQNNLNKLCKLIICLMFRKICLRTLLSMGKAVSETGTHTHTHTHAQINLNVIITNNKNYTFR